MVPKVKYNHYRKGDTYEGRVWEMPYDIEGCEVLVQFKRRKTDTTAVFQFSTSDGTLIVDGLLNELTWIGRDLNYPPGEYFYDVQFTFPDGTIDTQGEDKLTIFQDTSA